MFKISLESARINAGYTQKEVAKMLDKSVKTISAWERGKTSPTIADFEKICEIYDVPKEVIFFKN